MIGIQQIRRDRGKRRRTNVSICGYNAANQFSTISRYEDLNGHDLSPHRTTRSDNAGRLTGLTAQPTRQSSWPITDGLRFRDGSSHRLPHQRHRRLQPTTTPIQLTAATTLTTAGQTPPSGQRSPTRFRTLNRNRDDGLDEARDRQPSTFPTARIILIRWRRDRQGKRICSARKRLRLGFPQQPERSDRERRRWCDGQKRFVSGY